MKPGRVRKLSSEPKPNELLYYWTRIEREIAQRLEKREAQRKLNDRRGK